jgi:hypothetical protein
MKTPMKEQHVSDRTSNDRPSGGTIGGACARGMMLGAALGVTLAVLSLIWFLIHNPLLVDSLGLALLFVVVIPAVVLGVLGLVVGLLAGMVTGGRAGASTLGARKWLLAIVIIGIAAGLGGFGLHVMASGSTGNGGLKLLMIGVDGATWRVARPMIERGELPNIAAAAEAGSSGTLMSMSPMFSPRIFTTLASGKVADKHGVMGPSDTTTDAVLVKRIWEILHEQRGWDYGVVEWYVTGPPEASPGGFCIPGPPAVLPETVPAELSFLKSIEGSAGGSRGGKKELVGLALRAASRGATMSTLVELAGVGLMKLRDAPKPDLYRRQHAAIVRLTTDVTLWQLRRGEVEMLATVYRSTDRLSHSYWRYHEPEAFADTEPASLDQYGDTIEDIYALVDEQIGRLTPCLAEDGVLLIFSDHGFQPYLTVRAEPFSFKTETLLRGLGIDPSDLTYVNLGYGFYLQPLTTDERANAARRAELTEILSSAMVEGTDIQAFGVDNVDKEGTGDDYVKVNAAGALLDLIPMDPKIVLPNGTSVQTTAFMTASEWSGAHDFDGIIIARGRPFTPGGQIGEASVLDVTPTALAAVGLPLANDMDGYPLVSAMTPEFLDAHPLTAVESYETEIREKQEHEGMDTMSEDLKEQLRSIGYIE